MSYRKIEEADLAKKRVFLRVDFNVPLDKEGKITDDKRIKAAIPTIKYLLKKKAIIILASHLGRPDGKVVEELRLIAIAKRLEELLKRKVIKLDDCIGENIKNAVAAAKPKTIFMLENLRFHKEEQAGDKEFAGKLAELADIYVNDAFGACHKAEASISGIPSIIPGYAGFLLQKEIDNLSAALKNPARPFVVLLGGSKVFDKIKTIENLSKIADAVLIGGAMAFTFLKSEGIQVGKSKVEDDKLQIAKELLEKSNKKIILPVDFIAADKVDEKASVKKMKIVKGDMIGVDIGPETTKIFQQIISEAKTVVWNGPMGVSEIKKFEKGTKKIAKAIAKNVNALTIIGGGDTIAAIERFKLAKKYSFVSTGGGAMLEFFEGKELPGIKALRK